MTTNVNSATTGSGSQTGNQQQDLTLGSLIGPLSGIAAAGLLNPSGVGQLASLIGSGGSGVLNFLQSLLSSGGGGDFTSANTPEFLEGISALL